jgi:hypothetical protein
VAVEDDLLTSPESSPASAWAFAGSVPSSVTLWPGGERPRGDAKLAVLVLLGVLIPLHVISSRTRAISASLVAGSLFIVWLGVELTQG